MEPGLSLKKEKEKKNLKTWKQALDKNGTYRLGHIIPSLDNKWHLHLKVGTGVQDSIFSLGICIRGYVLRKQHAVLEPELRIQQVVLEPELRIQQVFLEPELQIQKVVLEQHIIFYF